MAVAARRPDAQAPRCLLASRSVLVAGASVLNLAVAQFLLRSRPGEDLTDINGFGSNLFGIGLALLVSFLLLPVVAFGMAIAVEIVDALARHEEIDAVTAFRRVLVHPGGWVVAISVYIVVTLLAADLVAAAGGALPDGPLGGRRCRRPSSRTRACAPGLRRSSRAHEGPADPRRRSSAGSSCGSAFSLPSGIGASCCSPPAGRSG